MTGDMSLLGVIINQNIVENHAVLPKELLRIKKQGIQNIAGPCLSGFNW